MKVYEPCKDPCEICGTGQVTMLPYVMKPGKDRPVMMGVCNECRDKVPYPVIPVKLEMDQGFFFCPYVPEVRTPTDPGEVRFREEASQPRLTLGEFVMEDNSDKPPIVVDTIEKLHQYYGGEEPFQSKALAELAASDGSWVVPVDGGP